tara:strand:+ start:270 stop:392 length:123 start_codon:yes stop_codon:yes gene_type:complete
MKKIFNHYEVRDKLKEDNKKYIVRDYDKNFNIVIYNYLVI